MRALVIEDDGATRAVLISTLRGRRHDVVASEDAEAAWTGIAADPTPFDLAVVDIGLPGQDGIAFCQQFRRHAAGRHAVLLLVTADDRPETLEASLDAGVHDYVLKPVDRRTLGTRLAIAEQRSLANATSRYSREALRESESRFEAFMSNSPAAAFIKDGHGRFLYVNRGYLQAFQVAESDRLGRTHFEVYPAEVAESQQRSDDCVLATGQPHESLERVVLPDGMHEWLTYKFPLNDNHGHPTLVAALAIDVTARLAAERALQAQASQLAIEKATARRERDRAEALLRISRIVTESSDLQATLQAVCTQTRLAVGTSRGSVLLYYPSEKVLRVEAVSGGPPGLLPPGAFDPSPLWVHERIAPISVPVVALPDIRAMDFSPNFQRMWDAEYRSIVFVRMLHDGELVGVMGAVEIGQRREFSDEDLALLRGIAEIGALAIRNARLLEERRRTEEQMRNAQKLESLGVLAGGIAHDFNNLLVGVLGNAGLALMELREESPVHQAVKDIETSAQRAAELTRQMLAYSGRGKFLVEPVNLSRIVEEMTQLLGRVISKQVRLELRLSRELPAIVADVTQVRQVVMNLITNASDAFDGKPGLITLGTAVVHASPEMLASTYLNEQLPAGSYVSLEVTDSGVGMDEQTRARIFEPFFTTKFTGRGLGLAAVLGIVRGHHGAIDVRSEVGGGTTFRVFFPAAASKAASDVVAASPARPWRGSGEILLVDDEEAVRGVAARVLERTGFDVVEAASGEEALEICARFGSRLRGVLLDLTMPGLGGEATYRELRERWPQLPVIVSSGYMPQEGELRDVPFLPKPYRPSELLDILRGLLEPRPSPPAIA